MCIYMQIFAYLTNTSVVRKSLNVQRMHRHEYSSARGPEDFIGHTREAAKPSAALPQKQRPSIQTVSDPKTQISRSWIRRVDRPMDRYAVTSLKAHSSLMASSPGRKCICQESDWRQTIHRGVAKAHRIGSYYLGGSFQRLKCVSIGFHNYYDYCRIRTACTTWPTVAD